MKLGLALLVILVGCVIGDDGDVDDDSDFIDTSSSDAVLDSHALEPGVNGQECVASPFNCRFHAGDSRVTTATGGEVWAIVPGASVRDGNGNALATETGVSMTFNYGQTRSLAGKAHALALTTSNGSAGWYPFDHISDETSFRAQVGNVDAKDTGKDRMGCYEIRDAADLTLAAKKVVYNSHEGPTGHERAGDYLPLERNNDKRSANLIFSVPGFALGGATTDHFQAGTKFRRISVPTVTGRPSISIPLWVMDGNGAYKKQSGSMRFLYGLVRASDGVKRFGWMAQDALTPSSGCP